jgi:hypothetical protein
MKRWLIGVIVLMAVGAAGGCALFERDKAASCDGTEKRVANKGKWNGEMSFGCRGPDL